MGKKTIKMEMSTAEPRAPAMSFPAPVCFKLALRMGFPNLGYTVCVQDPLKADGFPHMIEAFKISR